MSSPAISFLVFYFLVAFVLGIVLHTIFSFSFVGVGILGAVGIFFVVFFRYSSMRIGAVLFLGLAIGAFVHAQAVQTMQESELFLLNDKGATVIQGVIVQEPEYREKTVHLVVQPENIQGRMLVVKEKLYTYAYGDRVVVQGALETPQPFEGFDYQAFLQIEKVYSVMFFPKIERVAHGQGNVFMYNVLQVKQKLRSVLSQNLSAPQEGILAAMLLGDTSKLSKTLQEQFSKTGLRHITAISGMHVAIVVLLISALLLALGVQKQYALFTTLACVVLFVVMTGLQPSAVRAGTMGAMVLLAQLAGRNSMSLRALVVAAFAMLLVNPFLLHSVGFQLSFGAVFGIITFLPWLQKVFVRVPAFIRDIVSITIAAQVFTIPILLFHFGMVSLVSLVANILVVPLLPLVMGFGFVFLLGGLLVPFLAGILVFPVFFLLSYIVFVATTLSSIPFSSVQPSLLVLGLAYAYFFFLFWKYKTKDDSIYV